MQQIIIEQDHTQVRVCTWGSKEKPTIICFHGLGSTCLSFLELGELLQKEYFVVSIEIPGHGKTDPFLKAEDYGIPYLIPWLATIIDRFAPKRFYLMAHSWGACLALHYTVRYPTRVQKLLLIDGGYHQKQAMYDYFMKADSTKLDFKTSCSLAEEIAEYEADFDGYVFSNWQDFLRVEHDNYSRWSPLIEEAARDLMREDSDGFIRFCASGATAKAAILSMNQYPTSPIFSKIHTSILLLQATLPPSWNEIRTLMVQDFQRQTNSVVKRIEASHLIHWDNPFLVARETQDWFI